MVRANTRTLGNEAEQLAFRFLRRRGLKPVRRNFRCRLGEIDLIMLAGECLVFVEVRYRAPNRFGRAAFTVGPHKQRKLAKAAAVFLASSPFYQRHSTRFDVVGVDRDANNRISIEWLVDAFRPGSR
ncbi:MAG: YraN family protein [Proteobacteria bacterium]|nr:YraN family protein [Pseudomonadota bacterium]